MKYEEMLFRGNVVRGNVVRENVVQGNVVRGNVTRGNVFSGKCAFGEMIYGGNGPRGNDNTRKRTQSDFLIKNKNKSVLIFFFEF
jgi:hypothetical protein